MIRSAASSSLDRPPTEVRVCSGSSNRGELIDLYMMIGLQISAISLATNYKMKRL